MKRRSAAVKRRSRSIKHTCAIIAVGKDLVRIGLYPGGRKRQWLMYGRCGRSDDDDDNLVEVAQHFSTVNVVAAIRCFGTSRVVCGLCKGHMLWPSSTLHMLLRQAPKSPPCSPFFAPQHRQFAGRPRRMRRGAWKNIAWSPTPGQAVWPLVQRCASQHTSTALCSITNNDGPGVFLLSARRVSPPQRLVLGNILRK